MEEYPEELRTPPVTLVSLVGLPEIHHTVSSFLHSQQPPVNTLALPDFSKISLLVRKQRDDAGTASAAGILKRDWLLKHRTKVPAVVAAVFSVDSVSGDPAQWQQVCTDIDNVKAMVRGRNIKFVVVLVQMSMKDDVNEDLMIALRKRAEIDAKHLIVFGQRNPSEQRQSLIRLAGLFAELSNTYYRDEGRRIKARIEKKNISSLELNIRYYFKVGVYAEFRRDWAEALRFYEDGYHALQEMIKLSTRLPPIQRLVEIKVVAEQFHFKVSTLLLHGGKVPEAITWFQKHSESYERVVGLPEVEYLHWEWMSRQYLVFAELLETSSASSPTTASPHFGMPDNPLTEWQFQPAYYYQLSAAYLRKKKDSLNRALTTSGFSDIADTMGTNPDSVIPSAFVGQSSRLLDQGDELSMLPLNDAEYACYTLAEGKRFQDTFEIIALFRRSVESFSSLKATRMASYCSIRVAREYFASKEFGNAKQLFIGASSLYRQEGWVALLWETLGYLRECFRELGSHKEFMECSLEMASLPIFSANNLDISNDNLEYGPGGAPSLSRRQVVQKEVLGLETKSSIPGDAYESTTSGEDESIQLEIDLVSPLRAVLLACVAFHDQSVKPGSSTLFTLALLSQLPMPFEVDQLELQFSQSACNFVVSNEERKLSPVNVFVEETCPRIEMARGLTLETNKWMQLTYEIRPAQSGKLECLSITAKVGPHLTLCCRAESPASMENLPLWKFEDQAETFPTKDAELSFSGQKVIQVEEPEPLVDLILNSAGPALVGETFIVPVSVASRGHAVHSGEIKINIVDARGGGLMSPREIEMSSYDNHQVELLSISGIIEEDESQRDGESIKKLTKTFGVVPVPFLGVGESWSGRLEIMWHRPKSVMLYVSLGYSANNTETAPQKVNVHKSLQIEGKIPLFVNHHFMLPFRREPLLLSKIKPELDSDQMVSLALGETSILTVSTKNSSEVPLHLISMCIESDNSEAANQCSVNCIGGSFSGHLLLAPGDEFKQVFSVIPHVHTAEMKVGSVHLKWKRDSKLNQETESDVTMEHKLPDVSVERAPLVVSLDCPPHAVLGVPFMAYVKVQNVTSFLQEIKYSLVDSQSFVFSGPHSSAAFVLPKSEHVIPYKLVPLSSGHQQLPKFSISSMKYSAAFRSSMAASTIFVFPSEPHFNLDEVNIVSVQKPAELSTT